MEMSVTTCCGCEPDLSYGIAAAIFFFAPVGAFVLRKHIAAATGRWKVAGQFLEGLALLSAPFAALLVASVVRQAFW